MSTGATASNSDLRSASGTPSTRAVTLPFVTATSDAAASGLVANTPAASASASQFLRTVPIIANSPESGAQQSRAPDYSTNAGPTGQSVRGCSALPTGRSR